MANLKEWILEAANGEPIEAIVFGEMGWGGNYGSEEVPHYDECPKGTPLSWEDGARFADYDFDHGYGAPGCQAVTAWTQTKVIFVSQYDGSTSIEYVQRHPVTHMPSMPGG